MNKQELDSLVEEYIYKCNEVLKTGSDDDAKALDYLIVGVFDNIIPNIHTGLHAYSYGGNHKEDIEMLREKLRLLKVLDGNYSRFNPKSKAIDITNNTTSSLLGSGNSTNTNNNTNTNIVNATFDVKTELDKARKEVEENEYLDDDAKEEINEQLNQIESVMGEDQSNNEKWKKLKSVVNWVTTKGYKIGQLVMPLITKALFPEAE
ncbi:hypothetical protein ACQPUL_10010 [Clostridium butyricum]|uniref:hypothetical protein n=1 Tax=Clostridium butyricum TaxID=1492 RepID=UPI003D343C18